MFTFDVFWGRPGSPSISGTQVQPQIKLDLGYLLDYLSAFYDYGFFEKSDEKVIIANLEASCNSCYWKFMFRVFFVVVTFSFRDAT